MTLHMVLEPRAQLPLWKRITPVLAVAVTRVLIVTTTPGRLEAVLRFVSRGARSASYDETNRARSDVVSVSIRCAGQYCLERSISAVLLLRMRGRWADWISGVNLQPFAAHAWLEVDGTPVGESLNLDGFQKNIVVQTSSRRARQ